MKKWGLAMVLLLVAAGGAFAEEAPAAPKTATVGGGVRNPWRPPYKTALVIFHPGVNP